MPTNGALPCMTALVIKCELSVNYVSPRLQREQVPVRLLLLHDQLVHLHEQLGKHGVGGDLVLALAPELDELQ